MQIQIDSKKIKEGDTFIAIKGINTDGHNYIDEAIKNGAKIIVAEHGLYSVETLIVPNTTEYLNDYLLNNYYDQIKDIKIIGMTGTNGKTTTCNLLHKALNMLGKKTAYIGTIGFYIDEKIKDLNNTTPNIYEVYQMLIEAKNQNCEYLVIEVSSHALALNRLPILQYDYAIFSNLTKDHLDYHLNFENYALAKQKLFKQLKDNHKCFINIDDPYKDYFLLEQNNNITYGINKSNYQITDYQITSTKTIFKVNETEYETKLLGKHNIYNLTVIIAFLQQLNIDNEQIKEIINKLEAPVGRMETIHYNDNVIIIDYAHTPDAVKKVISTVKEFEPKSVYTIIGCGGDRDKTKRPEMANIAVDLSTKAIFTNDNPRTENPDDIINDMIKDIDKTNYEIVLNRQKAIDMGIQMLEKNDILLILGKGHENYQIIGHEKTHFDDLEEVMKIIRS